MAGNPTSVSKDISSHTKGGSEGSTGTVVCFGEMLIDFVPTVSGVSLDEAPAFEKAPGGAPANVAVAIARLGGSSAFMGKVGEDEFGRMLANILKQNNVNNLGMRFDHNARTALAFVTLRADGEREFLFFRNPSADMLLQESELDVDLIKQASIFHYGSISLIEEPCRSAHLAAMKIAKASGGILSYDPNLRLPLWSSPEFARKEILSIWDQADVIKISEEEITFLTGGDDPYDDNVVLKKLFWPNLKLLIVTEGSQGCRYYTQVMSKKRFSFHLSKINVHLPFIIVESASFTKFGQHRAGNNMVFLQFGISCLKPHSMVVFLPFLLCRNSKAELLVLKQNLWTLPVQAMLLWVDFSIAWPLT
ncbi:hypothetical protein SAY86_011130 [Trapa natans]|uniref:fructokinase n=1 Tax=Trapa natans TaxID=22666 RepID=A0AAN7LWI1_TRANT|nr:hypothetical protein SAY86_011130 [Trapa natans]